MEPGQSQCTNVDLGYRQSQLRELFTDRLHMPMPFIRDLPYALILQPISAGFTGLAAGAALLALCTNSLLYTLAAFWAATLTIATLVIELVLFLDGRSKLKRELRAQNYSGQADVGLGPALWLQVAATGAVILGFFLVVIAWSMNRPSATAPTYEAPLPLYTKDDDPYGYDQPHAGGARIPDYHGPNYYADPGPTPGPPPGPPPGTMMAPMPGAAPGPAPLGPAAPVAAPTPGAPVASTGLGRAYDSQRPYDAGRSYEADQPYESARGPPRAALSDAAYADSMPSRRHSRHSRHTDGRGSRRDLERRHSHGRSGGHSRRHSSRSYGRESREDARRSRDEDFDYAYNVPSRTLSRQERTRERRRSRDPYLDSSNLYGMDRARHSSSASRHYHGDDEDFYSGARKRLSAGPSFQRYSERGAF